jgi:hypothetical protein
MDSINIVSENPLHTLPNAVPVFSDELKNILFKLEYYKGDSFNIATDTGQALVYYALRMNYEYQKQGNGSVPKNIVEDIWRQVLEAGKIVYKACSLEEFNRLVTEIYFNKVKEDWIISETIDFWERYKLGKID